MLNTASKFLSSILYSSFFIFIIFGLVFLPIVIISLYNEKDNSSSSSSSLSSSSSFLTSAWAKRDKPLAHELDDDDLCVKCQPDKNILQGQGLIVGTDYEDFIQGSFLDDQIFGRDGDDLIFGDLGIDRVYGGDGLDSIQGSSGNDQLLGQDGPDDIFGGFDDDLLVGGDGNDHLFGDFGNDLLKGDEGANFFDCGEGLDKIIDFDPKKGDITAGNCEIF